MTYWIQSSNLTPLKAFSYECNSRRKDGNLYGASEENYVGKQGSPELINEKLGQSKRTRKHAMKNSVGKKGTNLLR